VQATTYVAKSAAATVGRWLARLLVWTLAACVVMAIVVLLILPRATGGFAMTVLTGSMTPDIPVGSVVFVRPVDPMTLRVGDVATYRPEQNKDAFITHRVIEITEKGPNREFVFKGDANNDRDFEPVSSRDVVGEVWFHVPYLGSVRDALHGKAGLSLLAMVVLGGYTLAQLGGAFGESRRKRSGGGLRSVTVEIAAPVVVATLPGELVDGWNALVLEEREDGCARILLRPAPDAATATVVLLEEQAATDIVVLTGPVTLTGAPQLTSQPRESQHA
jgi:signal peptidase